MGAWAGADSAPAEGALAGTSLQALHFRGSRRACEALADGLGQRLIPEPLSISTFEAGADGDWALEAHFEAAPDPADLAEILAGIGIAAFEVSIAPLAARDWVRLSLEGLTPVVAGRFCVHGAHDRHLVPGGAIGIEIDAGEAFGTGHHETTRACLLALDRLVRRRPPARVLDVGTGSGVLAIAAARAHHVQVIATDNDPVAVRVARANAAVNAAAPFVRAFVADGVRSRAVAEGAPYDLVFANILALPLAKLAGDIAPLVARGGHVVLSGILNGQARCVAASYAARGLRLERRIVLGDWTSVVMTRPAA